MGYAEKGMLGIEWDVVNKPQQMGDAIGKNPGADLMFIICMEIERNALLR